MYRINSISKQMLNLQVVQNDTLKAVNLLPGNFVFTDKVTPQLSNLQANKCIRIHEVAKSSAAPLSNASSSKVSNTTNKETEKSSSTAANSSGSSVKSTKDKAENSSSK